MTLRNVPKSFTLEQQRLEINELAIDLDAAVDGVQTFTGEKTFSNNTIFSSDVTFETQAFWGDGDQAIFGNDSDLKIYYDGGVGVETSFIDSDALQIRSITDSELYATFLKDGAVELYYDGDKKFGTSSTGASVIGDLDVGGDLDLNGDLDVQEFVTLCSTSGNVVLGSSTNPNANISIYAGTSPGTTNYFQLRASSNEAYITNTGGSGSGGGMNISARTTLGLYSGGTGGQYITFVSDSNGAANLYYQSLKKLETTTSGVSITGTISATEFSGPVTGNADTATALETARNIAGQSFDGTADITIAATDLSDTDQALATTSDVTFNSVDATSFTIGGNPLQTDVATTSSVGTVQPDGTTIGIDANGVISVTGGGDPFTANGFKFGVNEATGPAATLGEFRQISGKPYFYDGTAWQEFILGSTQVTTIPAETAWDKVIVRSTFDSDFDDVKFGDTGNPNTYTTGYNGSGINASTLVATPAKFGTNVLKSVGNGVVYPHRAEYDFTGEFTIECWVYFDSAPEVYTTAVGEKHVIFSKANAGFTDGSWQIYVKQASNGNHFWYIDIHDTATSSETQYQLDSIGSGWSTSGYDQQWVHIALVKESDGTLHFYKNGVDGLFTVQDFVSGNDITNTTHPLAIGMPQESGQAINDIYIDDLRITTDARYTSNGNYGVADFTPPTSAHPISGTTTTYTPPATSKAGEITLGATPTWTGTAGVTVSQQSSGNYRMTFTNPFTNATDYYVFTNHMDYIGAQKVFVTTGRSNTHVDFTVYREGDGAFVDTGSVAVQVIAH